MAATIATGLLCLLLGIFIGRVIFATEPGYTGPVSEWEEGADSMAG